MEENFQNQNPLLIVISGPSGVGKDTVVDRLQELSEGFHFVITATTRAPRDNEVHGRDYFFYTVDEFADMIDNDELLEYAFVYNDYKGIPKEQVRKALSTGKDVIMRVDVQGAATVKRICPDALLVFLNTKDEAEFVNRLRNRKTDTEEQIKLRIATARQELKRINEFDYEVLNREDRLDDAVNTILSIIDAEHHKVEQRKVTL